MRKGAILLGVALVAAGLFLIYDQGEAGAWSTTEPTVATTNEADTFEGRLVGVSTPAVGLSVPDVGPAETSENLVTVDVDETTRTLGLDLTADVTKGQGELDMLVAPPGCEPNTGCEVEVATTDGKTSWETQDPADGEWTIRLFFDAPGGGIADWTLDVQRIVPTS